MGTEAAAGAIQHQLWFVFGFEQQRSWHCLSVYRDGLDLDTLLALPFRVVEHLLDRALLLPIEFAGCQRHIPAGLENIQVLVLGMGTAADGGICGPRLPVAIPLASDRCGKVQLRKPGEQLCRCQAQGRMIGALSGHLGVLVKISGRLGILARV
ncbi:hypothetical protein HFV04_000895 [Pseudomonas sp. BIGb0427]|nr:MULTISPECIES: hypothetical protein [unclassified Pseudomonas]QPG63374.1 hypothetical protein HFV04_000895 [Pseudomonas sp. BIGb0427]UVM65819.1 hypothetical protein LOY34_21285 [Pseudomonas sp. B21-009]